MKRKIIKLRWEELEYLLWEGKYKKQLYQYSLATKNIKKNKIITIFKDGIYKQVITGIYGIEFKELHIYQNESFVKTNFDNLLDHQDLIRIDIESELNNDNNEETNFDEENWFVGF